MLLCLIEWDCSLTRRASLFLLGVWMWGPLAMLVSARFSGGGLHWMSDVKGSIFVFVMFPISTPMMATYDGTLPALIIFTSLFTLIIVSARGTKIDWVRQTRCEAHIFRAVDTVSRLASSSEVPKQSFPHGRFLARIRIPKKAVFRACRIGFIEDRDSILLRTHTCGELRVKNIGEQVTLCGWVDTYRDHGGQLFADLRDRYGKTQIVFTPERGDETLQQSKALRSEFVILVRGDVAPRPEGTVNSKLETGEVEVRVRHLEILNKTRRLPFQPTGGELPGEDLRLKYRYIDLRRPSMQSTLVLRHRIIKFSSRLFRRAAFYRSRNARARSQHAGRCPRLPRAESRSKRQFLRPAAIAATLQANPHGGGLRSLYAGRPVLSRRRPAPIASRSSRSWTWKCRSSTPRTSWGSSTA